MVSEVKKLVVSENEKHELLGLLAEFDDAHALIHGAETMRDAGFTRWDCHTPFPVHGLNDAMGLRPTNLPYLAFIYGLGGLTVGLLMQWWMNAYDYQYMISGKPLWSVPANIPIAFEMTILFAALGTFLTMFILNGLPQYYHPVFTSERFKRASDDRFFISVDARDPKFDATETAAMLRDIDGCLNVEELNGERGFEPPKLPID